MLQCWMMQFEVSQCPNGGGLMIIAPQWAFHLLFGSPPPQSEVFLPLFQNSPHYFTLTSRCFRPHLTVSYLRSLFQTFPSLCQTSPSLFQSSTYCFRFLLTRSNLSLPVSGLLVTVSGSFLSVSNPLFSISILLLHVSRSHSLYYV